ncbi:MAG: hypothetical protein AB7V25_12155 [Mangrovibacterium sp.]
MIRTGILTDTDTGSKPGKALSLLKEMIFPFVIPFGDKVGCLSAEAESAIQSSDAIYVDMTAFTADQIRTAFRSSTHVFFRRMPRLTLNETHELISLQNEACCVTQLFLPHLFLPEHLSLLKHLQRPLLINVRLKALPAGKLEQQLLKIFLFLTVLDKSTLKKLDVNTLEGEDQSYMLDIRLSYSSGSVARLILSTHFSEDQSVLELFRISKPIISLPVRDLDEIQLINSEQIALREFIKGIKGQAAVLVSLNEIYQAGLMMRDVNEKLRMRGSFLL